MSSLIGIYELIVCEIVAAGLTSALAYLVYLWRNKHSISNWRPLERHIRALALRLMDTITLVVESRLATLEVALFGCSSESLLKVKEVMKNGTDPKAEDADQRTAQDG